MQLTFNSIDAVLQFASKFVAVPFKRVTSVGEIRIGDAVLLCDPKETPDSQLTGETEDIGQVIGVNPINNDVIVHWGGMGLSQEWPADRLVILNPSREQE